MLSHHQMDNAAEQSVSLVCVSSCSYLLLVKRLKSNLKQQNSWLTAHTTSQNIPTLTH